jgi:hypothetical protein
VGPCADPATVEASLGQPVTVFPAGYYTAESVECVKRAPVPQLAADALMPACPEHGRSGDLYCAAHHIACYARGRR